MYHIHTNICDVYVRCGSLLREKSSKRHRIHVDECVQARVCGCMSACAWKGNKRKEGPVRIDLTGVFDSEILIVTVCHSCAISIGCVLCFFLHTHATICEPIHQ